MGNIAGYLSDVCIDADYGQYGLNFIRPIEPV